MTKFLVLHNSSVSAGELMKSATPEEMKTSMDVWMKWKNEADKSVKIEFGMPLQLVGRVISGGMIDSDIKVTGYSILESGSSDALMKVLQTHPHLSRADASLDVLEMLSMPGMSQE